MQVEGARGKVNVSSVNEKITITDASGEITAESINGAITMTGIDSKSVEASTVNGTIIYEGKLADGGHYSFGTHNGDVSLGVPENANATFTIRTYQGSFQTDLPLPSVKPRRHPARPPRGDDARHRQRGREPGNVRGVDSVRRGTAASAGGSGVTGPTRRALRAPAAPSPGRAALPAGAGTARSGRAHPRTSRLPDGHPEM